MKKPNTEKPTCHVCGKQFKNQSRKFLLKKHLLFQHNIDEGAVFCEICPKTVFFSKRNYNKHMEKEHSGKVKEDEQIQATFEKKILYHKENLINSSQVSC